MSGNTDVVHSHIERHDDGSPKSAEVVLGDGRTGYHKYVNNPRTTSLGSAAMRISCQRPSRMRGRSQFRISKRRELPKSKDWIRAPGETSVPFFLCGILIIVKKHTNKIRGESIYFKRI